MFIFNIKNITYVSLFCDRNTNDVISTGKKCLVEFPYEAERVFSRIFPRLKWRHSCFYHSTETQKPCSICNKIKITSVLRQKCGFVCAICVSVLY